MAERYERSSAHRVDVALDLAHARTPSISGHASVWTGVVDGSVARNVFLLLDDEHDRAKAIVILSVDQAERTAALLQTLADRLRAMPAPPADAPLTAGRVEGPTAWPPDAAAAEEGQEN